MTDHLQSRPHDLHALAETAVALWEDLTGFKIDANSVTVRLGDEFPVYSAAQEIQRAQDLNDATVLTLIIRQLLAQYCQSKTCSFTLAQLLDGAYADVEALLKPIQALQTHLDDERILTAHENYFQDCCEALAFYRDQPVASVTDQTREFVRIRSGTIGLDAVHDLKKLTKLTMFEGTPAQDVDPKVNRLIFAFDNLEELIDHGASIPSGFSLCAILSEHISDSYFVLVVRNGERVVIVTDKGSYSHPLQQPRMRQRNVRYNMDRIDDSRFPYGLINIVWSDNGRRAVAGKGATDLMVTDLGFRVLGSLSDLGDWDLLWFHLFVQQCRQRYFIDQVTEPPMGTGSMIQIAHPWVEKELFPVPSTMRIPFQTLSSRELTTEFMHSSDRGLENRVNPNRWMEERFAHQVPDESLYVPASALPGESRKPKFSYDNGSLTLGVVNTEELPRISSERGMILPLVPIDPTSLTTTDQLKRDVHFIARYNQCQVIKKLVHLDYEAREREMIEWFNQAVVDNLPNFIDDLLALNHERFIISAEVQAAIMSGLTETRNRFTSSIGTRFRSVDVSYEPRSGDRIFSRIEELQTPKIKHLLDLVDFDYMCDLCYLDGEEMAKVYLSLPVSTVGDIMTLTGLPMEEIPKELHTMGINVYVGNGILDRLDPLAELDNPWDKLRLNFRLPLSLKNFKKWRRARGLEMPKATELEAWNKRTVEELRREFFSTRKESESEHDW